MFQRAESEYVFSVVNIVNSILIRVNATKVH